MMDTYNIFASLKTNVVDLSALLLVGEELLLFPVHI